MLERWTNGLYRSTLHRVLTVVNTTNDDTENGNKAQARQRLSIPFFYEPAYDTVVSCLPTCCNDTDNSPRYPPITSGEHLLQKYKETHADFTPAGAEIPNQ